MKLRELKSYYLKLRKGYVDFLEAPDCTSFMQESLIKEIAKVDEYLNLLFRIEVTNATSFPIAQISIEEDVVAIYPSIADAVCYNGIAKTTLMRYVDRPHKCFNHYYWVKLPDDFSSRHIMGNPFFGTDEMREETLKVFKELLIREYDGV